MPTIVLTGGGSGGHITPLLSLARALKTKNPSCKIIYIGLKGEKLEGLQERYDAFDQVCHVTSGKYRRYHGQSFLAHLVDFKTLALNMRDFFRVLLGILSSRRLLKQLKPDLVFSKGSYAAVPVGVAAHQLKIPIITHDSDAVPGLANRILGRWAAVRAVGQPIESYAYPSMVFTGIPVDENVRLVTSAQQVSYKKELGIPEDSLLLLVTGGGLGSGNLNELLAQSSPLLLQNTPKLHIILIAGQQYQAASQAIFENMPDAKGRAQVIGFTSEFYRYSGAADLILCRAGASTLAEFAIQQKALVVVPASQLAGGHQLANVEQLERLGAAEVLRGELTAEKLFNTISGLLQNQNRREELAAKLGTLAQPQAASKLANVILQTIAEKATA